MNNVVINPYEYFADPTKGRPIFNGSIFIGEPDTDPEVPANQKQVYARQENGTEVAIPQPVATNAGGYPTYNGSVIAIVVDGYYSIKVNDKNGSQVLYGANLFSWAYTNPNDLLVTATGTTTPRSLADWLSKETLTYNTIAEAKADTKLDVGQIVLTTGYNNISDGGRAIYKVVAGGTGTEGGGLYHDADNGNQLELVPNSFSNSTAFGGTIELYVSTTGSDSNQGDIESEPFKTIQYAVDYLQSIASFVSGEANINLAAGTYNEGVVLNAVINTDSWWNIRGPIVTGGRVPTAILDGGSSISNGFSLQNTRVRFYDVKCQNFTAYGFTPSNQSIVELHNCHADSCGIAGVNSEIQNRMWIYGGLYTNNQYGCRIYSCSTGSIRVDSRVGDSTRFARFNSNNYGIQVREYSNVRGDDFICDGNSVSSVQVTNARMHLANSTLDNCPIGVDAQRKAEWFDDNITFGPGIVQKFRNLSFGLELSDFQARANEIISLIPTNVIHTGTLTETEIYNVYTVPANTFNINTKQFTLKGWANLASTTGTITVRVKYGSTVMAQRVFPATASDAMEFEIYMRADNSALQTVRSKFLRSLQQDILGQSKVADATVDADITVTAELADVGDSVTFYGCHLHRIT